MNLFGRRPLCVFCFLFFITALLVYGSESKMKLAVGGIIAFLALLCFLFSLLIKKIRSHLLIVLMCLLGIILSLANSYFRVDYKQRTAEQYVGEQSVAMTVIAQESKGKTSVEYLVDVSQIGENSVSYRCLLICPFITDFVPGDRIYANVELMTMSQTVNGLSGYDRTTAKDLHLVAVLHDENDALIRRAGDASLLTLLFRPSGIRVVTQRVKTQFSAYIDKIFDLQTSALVKSFFISDTSSVSALTFRDFRRCGVSHLMSVSGLHFSILLGMVDWLLRLFKLPKSARCVVSSVLAILFLALTGFALSACRSAFMVIMVYLNFLLMEDHDSPTALFVSMTVIVLISPHAISDLGLWMSFLATLGLVTVFPWIDSHIPYPLKCGKFVKKILLLGRSALQGIAITVIANLFLIPIYWMFFKEVSVITIVVNLLISPFAFWLLPMIVFALLFANIPFFGSVFVWIVRLLCQGILWIVQAFSNLKFATFSLNTSFANAIIPIFTLCMLMALLLPLKKKKWLVLVPAGFLVICFASFYIWLHLVGVPSLTYVQQNRSDSFIIQEKGETVVCSISDANRIEVYLLLSELRELSVVHIDTLVLGHYEQAHCDMLTAINNYILIDRLALSSPKNAEDVSCAKEIAVLTETYGIDLVFFEPETDCTLTRSVSMKMLRTHDKQDGIGFLFCGEEKQAAYITPTSASLMKKMTENSHFVFFGIYGNKMTFDTLVLPSKQEEAVWLFPCDMEKWENALPKEKSDVIYLEGESMVRRITIDFS